MAELLPFLREAHYWLSRVGMVIGLVMLGIAIFIGLIRHSDVTVLFRRATYVVVVFIAVECLIGLAMYITGLRPGDEVHLIYGAGALLALPFFIFVETTAKKRPAMGSYIWAFTLMVAIFLRSIMTGAPR